MAKLRALLLLVTLGGLVGCAARLNALRPGAGEACLLPLEPAPLGGTAACPAPRPAAPDLFDQVLDAVRLTRCDLTIPTARTERLIGQTLAHDRFRLPFFDPLHEAPLRFPAFARETMRWLDEAITGHAPTARTIQIAAQRLGYDVGEVCPFEGPAPSPAPLAAAVAEVIRAAGGIPDPEAIAADAAGIPLPLQEAVAWILTATIEVAKARAAAMARVPAEVRPFLFAAGPSLLGMSGAVLPTRLEAAYWDAVAGESFDYRVLYRAAARLARTIERSGIERLAGTTTASFSHATPWGQIIIGGPGNDVYDPVARSDVAGDLLLLVDVGGDDVYRIPVGATRSIDNPVSVVLDLAGNDTYGYVEVPDPLDAGAPSRLPSDAYGRDPEGRARSDEARQGAGRLGVGLLYDFGRGRDDYRSLRMSQGYGQFGVGVLYDDGGDDRYEAEALAQGSGLCGIGILLDRMGNDTYHTYVFSQGFGGVKGAGILADGAGNDHYEANPGDPDVGGDPLYPAPQLPGHSNASLSQGVGFGLRPLSAERAVSASGGLGVLRDLGDGDDTYVASVFAQGAGYWFGTGLFQDAGGQDSYDGFWYVQGAAAHMALAWFADEDGHDRYNQTLVPKSTSLGVGHDLGVAFHLDLGGHDVYRGAGLTFGAGFSQGIGIFVAVGGDVVFDGPAHIGFGSTGGDLFTGARATEPTYGFFLSAGPGNVYRSPDRPPGVRPDAIWRGRANPRQDPGAARGAGGDAATGRVSLP